jgi:hypothetical protein
MKQQCADSKQRKEARQSTSTAVCARNPAWSFPGSATWTRGQSSLPDQLLEMSIVQPWMHPPPWQHHILFSLLNLSLSTTINSPCISKEAISHPVLLTTNFHPPYPCPLLLFTGSTSSSETEFKWGPGWRKSFFSFFQKIITKYRERWSQISPTSPVPTPRRYSIRARARARATPCKTNPKFVPQLRQMVGQAE